VEHLVVKPQTKEELAMKKHQPSTKAVTIFIVIIGAVLFMPYLASAGQLQPSASPAPTMHTLEDIYQKLSAMENDIKFIRANFVPRFKDNGNGTVTDAITGFVWLKNANPCGIKNWQEAENFCCSLANGTAGLTDGSVAGDWRLPTKAQLEGIGTNPPITWQGDLPSVTWTMPGAPFTNVQSDLYWSYSGKCGDYGCASYRLNMANGDVQAFGEGSTYYVWPIRVGGCDLTRPVE
jgi:hypothetical protein